MLKKFQSIKLYIVLWVSLIILMLLSVSGVIISLSVNQSLKESYLNQLHNIQKEVAINMEDLFDETFRFSSWLAQEYADRYETTNNNVDLEEISKFFERFHKAHGYAEALFISTPEEDTEIFADSMGGAAVGLRWKDTGFNDNIRAALKGETFISSPGVSPQTGRVVQLFSTPVISNGEVIGIIGFSLELGVFCQEKISGVVVGKTGYPAIFTKEGIVFAHPNTDLVMTMDVNDYPFGDLMLNSETGETIEYEFQNIKKFGGIYRSDDYNFIIVTTLAISDISDESFSVIFRIVLIVIFGTVISMLLLVYIINNRFKPLQLAIETSEKMEHGDLSVDIDVRKQDEIGIVMTTLKSMIIKLRDVIESIMTGSKQIVVASGQLAEGNMDLSTRTEDQANSLQETSNMISDMNLSIKSNADDTDQANHLSIEVAEKAEKGSISVNKMITSMDEISESSDKISAIIDVINNIAFQTNLLALNASIEAARAGEQGKGFAVVAVEVRKLAKRSDKAASEITEIIKSSNQKVKEGVEIANIAGVMLDEINKSVSSVTELISSISNTSRKQLDNIESLDRTLSSLDDNTQKNASLVQETAAATEELSAQAQELYRNIEFFNIDRDDPPLLR